MVYSLISVAVNIALGVALFFTLGFQGIALATAAASWITVVQMLVYLRAKAIWTPSARATGKIIRVTLASIVVGGAVALASHFRDVLEAPVAALTGGTGAKEVTVILVCLAGGALYPVLLFAFGGVTPAEAKAAFRRRKGDVDAPSADLP
jgi:putative peptidoglycan lipid II flippase